MIGNAPVCPNCGNALTSGARPGDCPRCLLQLGIQPANDAARLSEQAGDLIGSYKLLEAIGEGGFGTVWIAEQLKPIRRRVALKIIKLGMDTREVIARFEAERQALALMDHPGIARVFDGGATGTGRPYFVMELVRGVPITEFCDGHKLSTHARIELFIKVCQAVQHAHQKGIIHRDLKPSNILVMDLDGTPAPKVIDFGIARATAQSLTDKTIFTAMHRLVGTPAYMSPEQAGLGGLDIDTRSDVYSLGVLLHELVTGRHLLDGLNFASADPETILRAIRETEPSKPSTRVGSLSPKQQEELAARRGEEPRVLNSLLRGELDWILLKVLEKDRVRRYETANGLAADLRRYLDGEPVRAAPPSLAYQVRKFAGRHRAVLATVSAFVLVLIIATAISVNQAVRATRLAEIEMDLRRQSQTNEVRLRELAASETLLRLQAETNEFYLRHVAYAADMASTAQALERGDFAAAREILAEHLPTEAHQRDIRGWEWRHLSQRAAGAPSLGLLGHSNMVTGLALDKSGETLWSCAYDGTVREWDLASRIERRAWKTGQHFWNALAIHSTEKRAVVVSASHNLAGLLDLETGTHKLVPLPPGTACFGVVPSPDGQSYLHGSGDWGFTTTNGLIFVRDLEFENPRLIPASGSRCAFSPDGRLLATGSWLDRIKLWRWPQLDLVAELGPVGPVGSLTFSPDGTLLASGSALGQLSVWDLGTRRLLGRTTAHENLPVGSVDFSRDGQFLVTSGGNQVVLWEVATLAARRVIRGFASSAWQALFAPDERHFISGSQQDGVRIWSLEEPLEDKIDLPYADRIHFSPDGRYCAAPLSRTEIVVWSPTEAGEIARLDDITRQFGFIPGNILVLAGIAIKLNPEEPERTVLRFCKVPSMETIHEVVLPQFPENMELCGPCAQVSPDGKLLVWAGQSGSLLVWDLATGRLRHRVAAHEGSVRAPRFSPDGRWLLSFGAGGKDLSAKLWDTASMGLARIFPPFERILKTADFSPDSKRVLLGAEDGTLAIFDRITGEKTATFRVENLSVARFDDSGHSIVATGYQHLHFFNLVSKRPSGTLALPEPAGGFLEFSPDGTVLAATSGITNSRLLLWSAGLETRFIGSVR